MCQRPFCAMVFVIMIQGNKEGAFVGGFPSLQAPIAGERGVKRFPRT
jgi:hypothetical protein